MNWQKTIFLTSAYATDTIPLRNLPEVAILGRSNVGKSTLLNALFQSKSLVKTSSRPGKTEAINYFLVDEKLLFADLPGFGYAKVAREKKQAWGKLVDSYVRHHPGIRLFLLLVDIRREIEEEEAGLIELAALRKIPLFIVLTKCDKLSTNELKNRLRLFQENPRLTSTTLISHAVGAHTQTESLRKEIIRELNL